MKIALVVGSLDLGGTETQVCRLAVELRRAGHDARVMVLTETGPLAATLEEEGVPFEAFGYGGIRFRNANRKLRPWVVLGELGKIVKMYRSLRRFRPQVCHAFLYWAYVIALPIAAVAGVPVRLSGRRGLTRPRADSPIYRGLERFSNRFAAAITANADAVVEDVVVHEGVDRKRIHVIRNGVDIPKEVADVEREPAVGMIVANLIGYKGHADLVRALAKIDRPPTIRALGEGAERAAITSLLAEHGLRDVLILEGSVPKASQRWVEAQFGVLASHEEGFPNAVLEAMAAGVPMVATSVGGVPELIDDGVTGSIVPAKDPDAMSEAIARLASDPQLRKKMGTAARQEAERYSWPRCVDAHLELYRSLGARD